MNKDQVKGRSESLKGKAKEVAGKITGNSRLTTQGKLDQIVGRARASFGDVVENIKSGMKKAVGKL